MKHPKLPEIRGYIVKDDWSPPDRPRDRAIRRQIVDWLALHEECRRVECRRAGACRSRMVACFEEERPVIVECVHDLIFDGYQVDVDALD